MSDLEMMGINVPAHRYVCVLRCVAVCRNVLQCVAVCGSVLQRAALFRAHNVGSRDDGCQCSCS